MTASAFTNAAQADYWSSASGRRWIEHEDALDEAMEGVLQLLLDGAALQPGDRIADIGCGTGASTLAAAARVQSGRVLGVDISELLLDRARERSGQAKSQNVELLLADAQTHGFESGAFDLMISRFGMMFFEDPVAAFRNLAQALRPGGRIVFVAWAESARNPWFKIPQDAAIERLGAAPSPDPHAPGPLAFADADRVAGLLRDAGLGQIRAETLNTHLTPPGEVADAARVASRVGPAARIMKARNGSEEDAEVIEAQIADRLRAYEQNGQVRVPAVVHRFFAMAI
jgi:SAM-dependent methyltransferase